MNDVGRPLTEPCDLSALEARRLIGNTQALARGAAGELPRAHRKHQPRRSTPSSPWMRPRHASARRRSSRRSAGGEDVGLLGRAAHRHQGPAGDARACAPPRGSLPVQGPRAAPRTSSASPTSARPAASSWPRPTRPEFGAGANTTNRVYGADRQSVRSRARPAPAPRAARRWRWHSARCRSPPAPTTAAACSTPAAFCGVVGFRPSPGVVPSVDRAAACSPVRRHGPMGRTVRGRAPAAARTGRPGQARSLLLAATATTSRRELTGADLGSAARSASRPISAARRSTTTSPRVFRSASARFRHAFREVEQARARLRRRARGVRGACAACSSSPRTASGWRSRAICSTATSSTTPSAGWPCRCGDVSPRARGADQALQARPRLLQARWTC